MTGREGNHKQEVHQSEFSGNTSQEKPEIFPPQRQLRSVRVGIVGADQPWKISQKDGEIRKVAIKVGIRVDGLGQGEVDGKR